MRVTSQLESMLRRVSKPARYVGGELNSVVKNWDDARVRLAFAFPEVYEVGMSNLGLLTLYDLVNREPDLLFERTFTPWPDMQAELRAAGWPLFTLESGRPVRDFDLVGFSLPYEQVYTNVLSTLSVAGIPLLASERTDADPIVLAGGSACYNPEPMADFVDLFAIGEGEDVLLELLHAYRELKVGDRRVPRAEFLRRAAAIPGIYVPSFYEVAYHPNGAVAAVTPTVPEAAAFVAKR
ncbi:MAG: B12-binding domain-containing radical SAM protein, partial [Chloroflexi bacterium]|nr:B12-binding domain-containing radical SAM protein [Chloroflexota bacterium]